MRVILVSLLVALAVASPLDDFNTFKAKYGRVYTSAAEEARRFEIFQANLLRIEELNRESPSAHFAINKFADLSEQEFASRFLTKAPGKFATGIEREPEGVALRETTAVNYTTPYLPTVQDQGTSCGACYAFATVEALESAWLKETGKTVVFSAQQLIDCDTKSFGCDGGYAETSLELLKTETANGGGAMTAAAYPYTGVSGNCSYSASSAVGHVQRLFSVQWDESVMSSKVLSYGALIVMLDATTIASYSSGVLTSTDKCLHDVNHAVLLVGWGTESNTDYWLLQNSWGTSWGEKGFFKIKRNAGTCLITVNAALGVVATSSSSSINNNEDNWADQAECHPRSDACGARVCGTAHNGCGGIVTCGTCSSDSACQSDGTCVSLYPTADDTTSYLADSTSSFTISTDGKDIVYASTTTPYSVSFLEWFTSKALVSDYYTSFSANIKVSANQVAGLGFLMGQANETDGVWFGAQPFSNGTALITLHQQYQGFNRSTNLGTLAWTDGAYNNLTVIYQTGSMGAEKIQVEVQVNGSALTAVGVARSGFPDSGSLFFAAAGNAIEFVAPTIHTFAKISFTAGCNVTADDIRNQLNKLTSTRPGAVDYSRKRSDSDTCTFGASFMDSSVVHGLGYTLGTEVPMNQMSYQLCTRVQEFVADGALDAVGFEISGLAEVAPVIASTIAMIELPVVAAAAAAGTAAALSTGAIVGIAVGASVGGIALVAGATTAVVVAARRKSDSGAEMESSGGVRSTISNNFKPAQGVDVMSNAPGMHQSITGRGAPIANA